MTELLSPAAYARHAGISRQAVSKGMKSGTIPHTPEGLIDPVAADAARDSASPSARRPARQAGAASSDTVITHPAAGAGDSVNEPLLAPAVHSPLAVARTAQAASKAQLDQLKLRKAMGELVDRQEIEAELTSTFRELRDRMLGLPALVKGPLVSMQEEAVIASYLTEQIRSVLDDLATRAAERLTNAGLGV